MSEGGALLVCGLDAFVAAWPGDPGSRDEPTSDDDAYARLSASLEDAEAAIVVSTDVAAVAWRVRGGSVIVLRSRRSVTPELVLLQADDEKAAMRAVQRDDAVERSVGQVTLPASCIVVDAAVHAQDLGDEPDRAGDALRGAASLRPPIILHGDAFSSVGTLVSLAGGLFDVRVGGSDDDLRWCRLVALGS